MIWLFQLAQMKKLDAEQGLSSIGSYRSLERVDSIPLEVEMTVFVDNPQIPSRLALQYSHRIRLAGQTHNTRPSNDSESIWSCDKTNKPAASWGKSWKSTTLTSLCQLVWWYKGVTVSSCTSKSLETILWNNFSVLQRAGDWGLLPNTRSPARPISKLSLPVKIP